MQSAPPPRLVVNPSGQFKNSGQTSLLFAGDFYLRPDHSFHNGCDLFSPEIIELLKQSTFAVVNFEGTLTAEVKQGIPKEGPYLALNHRAPALLESIGFQAVTLANNHAMDYGAEALRHTLRVCEDCGLQHVGAGLNSADATRAVSVRLPGNVRLQVLSFCEREFGVSAASKAGTAWLTSPEAQTAVGRAKEESDLVIVCAHGGNELMPLPSPQRRRQLQQLIDAGADLVIGHHPHVPQGWEQYAGRYIFYSLGDFYFDSIDGNRYDYRDWGFVVRVFLEDRCISSLEIVPYERIRDKILASGSLKDVGSRISYLQELSSIITGSEFEGYWQELAVRRLSSYRRFLRARLTTSFRERLKETLWMGRDMWSLWRFEASQERASNHHSSSILAKQMLGTLNVIRCESHRWTIETALAVLAGECEDLRSQKIKDKLEAMREFYEGGDIY